MRNPSTTSALPRILTRSETSDHRMRGSTAETTITATKPTLARVVEVVADRGSGVRAGGHAWTARVGGEQRRDLAPRRGGRGRRLSREPLDRATQQRCSREGIRAIRAHEKLILSIALVTSEIGRYRSTWPGGGLACQSMDWSSSGSRVRIGTT